MTVFKTESNTDAPDSRSEWLTTRLVLLSLERKPTQAKIVAWKPKQPISTGAAANDVLTLCSHARRDDKQRRPMQTNDREVS